MRDTRLTDVCCSTRAGFRYAGGYFAIFCGRLSASTHIRKMPHTHECLVSLLCQSKCFFGGKAQRKTWLWLCMTVPTKRCVHITLFTFCYRYIHSSFSHSVPICYSLFLLFFCFVSVLCVAVVAISVTIDRRKYCAFKLHYLIKWYCCALFLIVAYHLRVKDEETEEEEAKNGGKEAMIQNANELQHILLLFFFSFSFSISLLIVIRICF